MSLRLQIILTIFLTLAAGFAVFCFFYPLATVSGFELRIDGELVAEDTVCSMCEIENLLRQPLDEYAREIASERPELANVSCRIGLNGRIVCSAERKTPIVYVAAPKMYGLTRDRELLPLSAPHGMASIPVISGIQLNGNGLYESVDVQSLKHAMDVIEIMTAVSDRLVREVAQIDFRGDDATALYLRGSDVKVVLGSGDYRDKFIYLDMMLERIKGLPAGELDLRFGRSIIVRNLKSEEV